jgi:FkbM family methyltransferase
MSISHAIKYIEKYLWNRNWHYTVNRRLQSKGWDLRRFPHNYQLFGFMPELKNLLRQIDTEELPDLQILLQGFFIIASKKGNIYSQLGQELLVAEWTKSCVNPFYLEIGAYDPYEYSNIATLRQSLGWQGISLDPSSSSYSAFEEAGLLNNFINTAVGVNSGFAYFVEEGALSSTSTEKRPKSTAVKMIGIKELVTTLPQITYLSLDIEGGELEILREYPWNISKPLVITVEHNNVAEIKSSIFKVLTEHGYKRILNNLSNFESWFVLTKKI